MEATSFAGGETDVRVKGPSLLLTDLKDADAALDSLSARVKELEAERDKWSAQAMKEDDCRKMWQSRALRAEQQRDEAYERAAKVAEQEFSDPAIHPLYRNAAVVIAAAIPPSSPPVRAEVWKWRGSR